MPKILCIISLVVSVIIFLVFALNLAMGIPFGPAGGLLMNLCMIFSSAIVGGFSVWTYLEIR